MTDAGIVIVAWNAERVIPACLDAALTRCARVVVVDNASTDRTLDQVRARPQVKLIANPDNRGFAAAANQGIAALDCPCVLLLNPDAVLLTDLDGLVQSCLQPGVAAAGGKLVDQAGRPQSGFTVRRLPGPWTLILEALGGNRLWPRNPVNRRYRCLDLDLERPAEVEQPAGAFLMLRREVWHELGGFDEGFHPLWFEDVDFARRARSRGYRFLYTPLAVAAHRGGYSAAALNWESKQLYWYASLLRYTTKHFSRPAVWGVCLAVALGSVPRMIGGILAERNLKPAAVCGRLVRLAARCLIRGAGGGVIVLPIPAL